MFNYMWRYTYNLRGLYETPTLVEPEPKRRRTARRRGELIQDAREAGRTLLTEFESKQLLAAYGIPTVPTRIAAQRRRGGAMRGRASATRSCSSCTRETITHKTDVGGVQLNLRRRRRGARRPSARSRASVAEKAGARAFPRRDRAADGQAATATS